MFFSEAVEGRKDRHRISSISNSNSNFNRDLSSSLQSSSTSPRSIIFSQIVKISSITSTELFDLSPLFPFRLQTTTLYTSPFFKSWANPPLISILNKGFVSFPPKKSKTLTIFFSPEMSSSSETPFSLALLSLFLFLLSLVLLTNSQWHMTIYFG